MHIIISLTVEPSRQIFIIFLYLQTQWEWLKSQATTRAELITELLDKMNQFDKKYGALRKFLEESNALLESEKPVGQSAARIKEQMKMCQVCCQRCSLTLSKLRNQTKILRTECDL